MRKTVAVLLVAVLLGAVSAAFCACNDAEINARNYAAAAQLVLSVLIDGYNQLEYDTADGELHVSFAVERGENDRGRIDIDMRTGEITGMSMESGKPLNELLAKYDEYEYEPETAAAMRTEYEEQGSYYVRLGFKGRFGRAVPQHILSAVVGLFEFRAAGYVDGWRLCKRILVQPR